MQWFLNVHVHATFIEGRAHDAAARLTRACFLNIKKRKNKKKKSNYTESISSYVYKKRCIIYANKYKKFLILFSNLSSNNFATLCSNKEDIMC